jgi:glycosyltransferase involved in cell wall biosynthesis
MQPKIKPRVLIVHHTLWSHYKNGLYKYLLDHNKLLDIKILQISAIENTREGMPNTMVGDYAYTLLFDKVLEDVPHWQAFLKIKTEIDAFKPTVINVNGFFAPYHFFIMLYCRLKGIKIILSNDSTAIDNKATFLKDIVKSIILTLPHGFFCFGKKAADYMKRYGAKPEQIFAENMAVVDNDFIEKEYLKHIPEKEALKRSLGIETPKALLYLGRFIDFKNLEALVSCFAKLNNAEWSLVMVGDGPTWQKTKLAAGNAKNIHFLGAKSWQEVPQYYALANAFVLPSYSEPWGLVLNEAMVCQIPVLVSKNCGSENDLVIHEETGLVFDPFDNADFENKLHQLMTAYNTQWISKAKTNVKRFSFENATQTMTEAFCRLS